MLCKDAHDLWLLEKETALNNWETLQKAGIISNIMLKFVYLGNKENYYKKELKPKVFFNNPPACVGKTAKWHWLYIMGYLKHYKVPCGKCEICRVEKSKEWACKAWCEQQMWENTCFITLTYDNEHLPEDRKLRRSDIQKFWKDLRYHLYKDTKKACEIDLRQERENLKEQYTNDVIELRDYMRNVKRRNKKPIRYLNCGEYGPKTKRPHYHAQIWNFCPTDLKKWKQDERGYWLYNSKKLSKIWGKGWVVIEEANSKTAGYVARYCTKKYKRSEEEQEKMKQKHQQEFIGASSLGFIGWTYWEKYKESIKNNKGILMKENDHTVLRKIPKIMEKKWEEEEKDDDYLIYKIEKEKIGKENWNKILSQTSLTEEEYIEDCYRKRTRQYMLLKRDKGDIQGYN